MNIRFLKHLLQDLLIWTGIFFGFYVGIEWVENATSFAIVALSALGSFVGLAMVASKDLDLLGKAAEAHKSKTKLHQKYGPISLAMECIAVSAFGHFLLAGFWLVGSIIAHSGYEHAVKKMEDHLDDQ